MATAKPPSPRSGHSAMNDTATCIGWGEEVVGMLYSVVSGVMWDSRVLLPPDTGRRSKQEVERSRPTLAF